MWFQLLLLASLFVSSEGSSETECDGVCSSFGDPHYKTFDCKRFEFQGICSYTLVTTCASDAPYFEIIGENEKMKYHPDLAYTKNVVIRTTDTEFKLTSDREVFMNGDKQEGPTIKLDNVLISITEHGIALEHDLGFNVTFGSPFKAEIILTDSSLDGKVCGLCGNKNGDQSDDFATPTKTQVSDAVTFAASWNVNPHCVSDTAIANAVPAKVELSKTEPATTESPTTEPATTESTTTEPATTESPTTEPATTTPQVTSQLKLSGGLDEYEGRIWYTNSDSNGTQWIEMCQGLEFDLKIGAVVCRQLGLPNVTAAGGTSARFGYSPDDPYKQYGLYKIKYKFICNGDEDTLDQCDKVVNNDILCMCPSWVQCREGLEPASAPEGTIRLWGGNSSAEGFPMMYKNGTWTAFTPKNQRVASWNQDMVFSNALCRSMGYPGAQRTRGRELTYAMLSRMTNYVPYQWSYTLYNCTEDAQSLSNCSQTNNPPSVRYRKSKYMAYIRCQQVDYCAGVECQNGGTCVIDNDRFRCACPDFYEGVFCQLRGPCEKGWVYFKENPRPYTCYFVGNKPSVNAYRLATQQCNSMGSKVVEFEDMQQLTFIQDLLAKEAYFMGLYHIGLSTSVDHKWQWGVSKSPVPTWIWGPGVTTHKKEPSKLCAVIGAVNIDRGPGFGNYQTYPPYPQPYSCNTRSSIGVGFICQKQAPRPERGYFALPPEFVEGQILLKYGADESEGILHVVHNRQFGTVCDDRFDHRMARMACKQLGFAGGKIVSQKDYGFYETDRIWLDELKCEGNETSIVDCRHNGWGITACDHREDVALVCSKEGPRFVDGDIPSEGRLQYRSQEHNEWGFVCTDSWDKNDASVACQELGYPGVDNFFSPGFTPSTSANITMSTVRCTGNETKLAQCPQAEWGSFPCAKGNDVQMQCSEGDIRLVGTPYPNKGLLQVFRNDSWATICFPASSYSFKTLLCKKLGYSANRFETNRRFDQVQTLEMKHDYSGRQIPFYGCNPMEESFDVCLANGITPQELPASKSNMAWCMQEIVDCI